jgi:septum formation protein
MPSDLILASTSSYRRALLDRLGLPFKVVAPRVDESVRAEERPATRASRLAREKAMVVARNHPGSAVLGSDQVCAVDGRILDKPGSEERARRQLLEMSSSRVDFFTAVTLAWNRGQDHAEHLDHTQVGFRKLDEELVRRYVAREQPLDCAGSFKCEGLGIVLFENITSTDPTALIGLPLIAVTTLLAGAGIPVLNDA